MAGMLIGTAGRIGIKLFDLIVLATPWTADRRFSVILLSMALMFLPLPWIVIRMELKSLSGKLVAVRSPEAEFDIAKAIRGSMKNILVASYCTIVMLVLAFQDLVKH